MKNIEDSWITVARSPEFFQAAVSRAQKMNQPKEILSFWSRLRPGDLFRSSQECEKVQKNLANGPINLHPFDIDN